MTTGQLGGFGTNLTVAGSGGTGSPGQYPGTTTNDNASAGNIGEYVVSQVLQVAQVNAPSAGFTTVTTISLTAGDWDISGWGAFQPAATTSYTLLRSGISTASGTLNIPDGFFSFIASAQIDSTNQGIGFALPPVRASLNATTTYYLIANATYTVSTMGAYGTLRARRVR